MQFYIIDTTINPAQEKRFSSYNGVVDYLDSMSQRAYKQTKKQRAYLLEEIGYGEDDRNSTLFVRSMEESFNIGVIRDNKQVRCDITTLVAFQKPEYGD